MVNKIYINPESTITWTDTAGDEDLDLGGLAADAGRVGSAADRGTSARASEFHWQLKIDGFNTAPVVGESVDLYLAFTNDASVVDGPVGYGASTDSALASTNLLDNLLFLGSAVVRSTTAADNLVISGYASIDARYIIPVIHNNTADALLSTSDAHTFVLTPVPQEVQ